MTELDLEEKLAFVTRVTREMAAFTFPYIATLAAVEGAASGLAIGSAIRLRDGDRCWVVTAAHVVDDARRRTGRVAVAAIRGGAPVELVADPVRDDVADLCAFEVTGDFPDVPFWEMGERDDGDDDLSSDFMFVHGFPQVRGQFSPLLEALMTKSLPYGAMLRVDDLPGDLATHQLAIEFGAETMQGIDSDVAEWERPHGLSGSPVWRIHAGDGPASAWSPSRCRLVGVLTHWRPKEELLVATHVSRLAKMLRPGVLPGG